MRLSEADRRLYESVLHVGQDSFSPVKRHVAIKNVIQHLLYNVPGLLIPTQTITLPAESNGLDLGASIAGFTRDRFVMCYIGAHQVNETDYPTVMRRYLDRTPTGRPTMLAFRGDSFALLDRKADRNYDLDLTHLAVMPDFLPGTAEDVELPVPDAIAGDAIHWGGRYYLLLGLSGHPDASAAKEQFDQLVATARLRYPDPTTNRGRPRMLPAPIGAQPTMSQQK